VTARSEAQRTEEAFRDANTKIMDVARELELGGPVPILCECCDPSCHQVIRMPWSEFRSLHERNLFVVVPGHEHLEVEQLVAETPAYNLVEK
jgi:hypothetical protein